MDSYKKVLHLGSLTSGKEKEAYLKEHAGDTIFRTMLKWLLDDMITTGISAKKINKDVGDGDFQQIATFMDMLSYIKQNNTGRDYDVRTTQVFINSFDVEEEFMAFLKKFLTKELKCGISAKTYNKIFKNDKIYVFNLMLAKKYEDQMKKVIGKAFTITQKLDGNRLIIIKEKSKITAYTRNGKPMEGILEIFADIMRNVPYTNIVFDGELLAKNYDNLRSDDLFRLTMKLCRTKDENKTDLDYHVFDVLPLEDFIAGKCEDDFRKRKESLTEIINSGDFKHVKLVEDLYVGEDISKIDEFLRDAIERGEEGVMVNLNDAPYECKRTDSILKVKQMDTFDLRVISAYEGEGKLEGTLGGVVVEFEVDGEKHTTSCGSGFKENERHIIWNNKDVIVGKIAEIQHFGITKNQQGGYGLRFPVFLQIRTDKDEPSQN